MNHHRQALSAAEDKDPPLTFDKAMRRLAYVMGLGLFVVCVFGASRSPNPVAAMCSGLMIAFAATLGAGLIGFLFGIPYARETSGNLTPSSNEMDESQRSKSAATAYRPNTSLEQISDWLTKILVGVGLVEINQAPHVLSRVVAYLVPSFSTGAVAEAKPIIAALLIFFSVCGFLFGFLWARLYLRRWLVQYDQDAFKKELIEELSRFDADGKAGALATQQLERREDETVVSKEKLVTAFALASSSAKARIFQQASNASKDTSAPNYQTIKNPGAISIFQALIEDDAEQRYHRNHAELGKALDRRTPPDLQKAIDELSTAIARRESSGRGGWRYWEFRRAYNRVRLDTRPSSNEPSDPEVAKAIIEDLKVAHEENPALFDEWLDGAKNVSAWMKRNDIRFG